MYARQLIRRSALLLSFASIQMAATADEFKQFIKPIFAKNCVKCHGGEKVKGKVNLKEITNTSQFIAKPELIKELIEVIDAADMPPEDELQLKPTDPARTDPILTNMRAFFSAFFC